MRKQMKRILIIIFTILLFITPSVLVPSILDYFNYVDSEKPNSTEEKKPIERGVLFLRYKWYWFGKWYSGLGGWETSRNGDGKYLKYSGSILNGEPYGLGNTEYYPSGDFRTHGIHKYGILVNGIKHYSNGNISEGKWKRGKLHGNGSQKFQNGGFAIGKFKEGKFWNVQIFDINGILTGEYVNEEYKKINP